jgi:hypothetical protein
MLNLETRMLRNYFLEPEIECKFRFSLSYKHNIKPFCSYCEDFFMCFANKVLNYNGLLRDLKVD